MTAPARGWLAAKLSRVTSSEALIPEIDGLRFVAPEAVEFRKLSGVLPPGTAVEFTEFRGVPRTKFHLRVRDPGAAAMAINVDNLEGMVAQMKAAGVNLISANGELVDFGNGVRNIFVEDPNGLNLELIYRPAAPSPPAAPAAPPSR